MRYLLCLGLLLACTVRAQFPELTRGHLKAQYQLATFPENSLFRELTDTPGHDLNGEFRLLLGDGSNAWSWQVDYQLVARTGDTLELARLFSGTALAPNVALDDDRRLLDLTHVIVDSDDSIVLHRMDRLHLEYAGSKAVIRVGRQAVSWGNGLIYNPVDFFNPFDPAAVDKEFKTGDDMLYGQYLQDNGNDWQLVSVWRRNNKGNTDAGVNTHALKYHAFVDQREFDLLVARHYEDNIAALGSIGSLGGAIVRGDLMITGTDMDNYLSAVASLSYSWVLGSKNMSGVLEYFYNGLGLRESEYHEIAQHPDLLERLQRGELFTIGRHYLAGGATVEISPLFLFTPNVFINLEDGSGLTQLAGRYDFRQNWQLLLSMTLPFGSDGSEYGGLDSPVAGKQLGTGPALFAQVAYYF